MLVYYYSFEGYYKEDKLDNGNIGILSTIGKRPKINMETKCQGRSYSQSQNYLTIQYFVVLILAEVTF